MVSGCAHPIRSASGTIKIPEALALFVHILIHGKRMKKMSRRDRPHPALSLIRERENCFYSKRVFHAFAVYFDIRRVQKYLQN